MAAMRSPPWLVACGRFLFRWRNLVFPCALLAVLLLAPAGRRAGDAFEPLFDVLGTLLVVAGLALRGAVIGYAYIRRGGLKKQVYADSLVTRGFFALSRNPLYVGNLMIYGGLLVIHHSLWSYLLGGGFFLFAYRAIVAAEEAYLEARFGQAFADYCASTPRWWPRLGRMRPALRGMSFDWRRVIAKDYSTLAPALLAVLALLTSEHVRDAGWPAARAGASLAAMAAATIVAAMVLARIAKKSGALNR